MNDTQVAYQFYQVMADIISQFYLHPQDKNLLDSMISLPHFNRQGRKGGSFSNCEKCVKMNETQILTLLYDGYKIMPIK